ncbi:hypothetical protein ACFX1R_021118 [Malus domestica]
MSSSDCKSDEYPPHLYRQDVSFGKVGYFKAAHVKINFDELFWDFLEMYKHAIPSRVHIKRVKDDSGHESCDNDASARKKAIKFHQYYFALGFTFPMPRLFQEAICSMKCSSTQCSPNAVREIVMFSNLSRFLDLGLTINKFRYFFEIGHKKYVGQLRTHHRLLNASWKGDHMWTRNTLEVSRE